MSRSLTCINVVVGTALILALITVGCIYVAQTDSTFYVDVIPPDGMNDIVIKGFVDIRCPNVDVGIKYILPTSSTITHLQLQVENRSPIDLCRPTPTSPGSQPLCPAVNCEGTTCYNGYIKVRDVPLPVCSSLRTSYQDVRFVATTKQKIFESPLSLNH